MHAPSRQEFEGFCAEVDDLWEVSRQLLGTFIAEILDMARDVNDIEEALVERDKYYRRVRDKRGAELEGCVLDTGSMSGDLFDQIGGLRRDYEVLAARYGGANKNALVDGLHYLLSSSRKEDYEQLIVFRNTMAVLAGNIETRVGDDFVRRVAGVDEGSEACLDENLAKCVAALRALLPSGIGKGLVRLNEQLDTSGFDEIDVREGICFGSVDVGAGHAALDDAGRIVRGAMRVALKPLLSGDRISYPLAFGVGGLAAARVCYAERETAVAVGFARSVILRFLQSVDASRLNIRVADPRGRGDGVEPFRALLQRMPDAFGGDVMKTVEEARSGIAELSTYVTDCCNQKLSRASDDMFSHAEMQGEPVPPVTLLVLFDYPQWLDEDALYDLEVIIREGARCGVYTLILDQVDRDVAQARNLGSMLGDIEKLTLSLACQGGALTCAGLPLAYRELGEIAEREQFFSTIVWTALRRGEGYEIPTPVRDALRAPSPAEVGVCAARVREEYDVFCRAYCMRVPAEDVYPEALPLGEVRYPEELFAEATDGPVHRAWRVRSGAGYRVPFSLDLRAPCNVMVETSAGTEPERARALVHHLIACLMTAVPASMLSLCTYDPDQIVGLARLFGTPEDAGEKALLSSKDVIASKTDMREWLAAQRANLAAADGRLGVMSSIVEYNNAYPDAARPLTLLVVAGGPSSFDDRMVEDLEVIMRTGHKTGLLVALLPVDGAQDEGCLGRLAPMCLRVSCTAGAYRLMPLRLDLTLPDQPGSEGFRSYIRMYCDEWKHIERKGIGFGKIMPAELFSADLEGGRAYIPIGIGDGGVVVKYSFGGSGPSQHGLILGGTGGGKSTLLQTLIMSALMNYTPDQLNLYLLDFKKGTEFKIYDNYRLPHVKLLALSAMQEFGESILEELVVEMERRGQLFNSCGVDNRASYVKKTGKPLPLILVVMDEFQVLFNPETNGAVADHCSTMFDIITQQGRSFGVHVLMSTQSAHEVKGSTIKSAAIKQVRIRMGLKVDQSEVEWLSVSSAGQKAAFSLMKGPLGTAVLNEDCQYKECVSLRVAYCDRQTQATLLEQVQGRFADVPCDTRTFSADAVASMGEVFGLRSIRVGMSSTPELWLGEPVKVADPVCLAIDGQGRRNVLVCGPDALLTDALVDEMLLSAALCTEARILFVDGSPGSRGEARDQWRDSLCDLAGGRMCAAHKREDVLACIDEAYGRMLEGKQHEHGCPTLLVLEDYARVEVLCDLLEGGRIEEDGAPRARFLAADDYMGEAPGFDASGAHDDAVDPAIAAIMDSLSQTARSIEQRAGAARRALRETALRADDGATYADKLEQLIAKGWSSGMCVVATVRSYRVAKDTLRVGRNHLGKFDELLLFGVPKDDMQMLVPGKVPKEVPAGYVLYAGSAVPQASTSTGGGERLYMLIKPFALPNIEGLHKLFV